MVRSGARWLRRTRTEGRGALATSERTLQRRFTAVLDVEAIASEVGYDNGATLRALLHERLGRGVQELRGDLW